MTTQELIETLHDWATDVLNAHGGQSNPRAMQLETAASELSRLSKQLEEARELIGSLCGEFSHVESCDLPVSVDAGLEFLSK